MRLQASVITGFEQIAADEVFETFKAKVDRGRGHIRWFSEVDSIDTALKLRSIDNLYAVVADGSIKYLTHMKHDEAEEHIKKLLTWIDWPLVVSAWEKATHRNFTGSEKIEEQFFAYQDTKESQEGVPGSPTFRVTCNRAGDKKNHSFTSMEAAKWLGGSINSCFGWQADMKHYDIEIVLNIRWDEITCLLELNYGSSLFDRNITAFGPTTMRSTMCHCMARILRPKPGQVILDPMCGGGSIPIEAALSFKGCIFLAGDNHPLALERCAQNLAYNEHELLSPVLFAQWSATELPLKSDSVDSIVTDMPFGRKIGSHEDNRTLYPKLLNEWARVVKPGGVLVIMTHDKRSLDGALLDLKSRWRLKHKIAVNQGGLTTLCAMLICAKSLQLDCGDDDNDEQPEEEV